MDLNFTISILSLLLKCAISVSGADIPGPINLTVNIWDGEVEVLWDHPFQAPLEPCYHVQMKKYGNSHWVDVNSCIRTKVIYLTQCIKDYSSRYIVRVQLVTKEGQSAWITRKFYPNQSKLLLPSFNLVVTSSSVIVKVYRKPILRKIFPLGIMYLIHLEEMGLDNKTTVKYLSGENEDEDTVRFDSLHWGRLYCVSVKEMSISSQFSSEVSPQQCLHLPEDEWYITAVGSLAVLSVMGVFTILVTGILYFLRYPAKMPIALRDTKNSWSPLSVGEIPMEVVRDKGWFLIAAEPQIRTWLAQKMENAQALEIEEENGEEDRRTNKDSGVGMKFLDEGIGTDREFQGNSECDSLSNSESLKSNGNQTGESIMQERSFTQWVDSGMGLACQSDSSGSLEVEERCDPQPDTKYLAGDIYHSQNPCTLDGSDTFHQIPCEKQTVLADVVKEYISGHLNCVCLGTDHCVWCQTYRCYRCKKEKIYRCACSSNGFIDCNRSISHTCETTLSSYIRKTHIQMETVVSMDEWETISNLPSIDLECDFPLLMAMPAIPLEEEGLRSNMSILPLSLYDVELTIE